MSEKGFLFSIDALLAVSAIIAVSIAFFFLAPKTDSELFQVQMLRITANDKAITSFYLGDYSAKTVGSDDFIASKLTAYCSRIYSYTPETSPNQADIVPNDFCEGRQ